MGIKYYYSAPTQVRTVTCVADAEGRIIGPFNRKSNFVKWLPRVVICSILDENKLSFGYTTCSHKDLYTKKRGQKIAYARALNKPYEVVEISNTSDIKEVSARIITEIFDKESARIFG